MSVGLSWYIRIRISLPGCVTLALFDKEAGEESGVRDALCKGREESGMPYAKARKTAAAGALTRTSWSSWSRHRNTDEHPKVSHCSLLMLKRTPCVEI